MPRWSLKIEEDFALLLAAAIRPSAKVRTLARTDPKQREDDYIQAFKYYLHEHPRIRKYVFVENSGWPLDALQAAVIDDASHAEIEFISLNCNDRADGEFSTGYGESEIIRRGVERSKLIAKSQYFGKITGRLRLLNMSRILEKIYRPFEACVDMQSHHVPIRFVNTSGSWLAFSWGNQHHYQCDTRFFVMTPGFYHEHIKPLHEQPQPEGFYWIEGAWFRKLFPMRNDPGLIPRFPIQPHYSGYNGTLGFSYDSPKENFKRRLRASARMVVPFWWI